MSKAIEGHLLREWRVGELLGSGAYGHVWRVQDGRGGQWALKKVFGAFRNRTDAQRTYRQVATLRQLSHPNVIRLERVVAARNKEDLYLLFELMEADLLAVVGGLLSPHHHCFLLQQLLCALQHLHSRRLLHRDLKPSNLLLDAHCRLKLCDFGLARTLGALQEDAQILSEEVASKWYRAPELLLGSRSYGTPADMWSVGCIAAELLTGKRLFSGASTLEQLERIIELTGLVGKQDLEALDSPVAECLISQIRPRLRCFQEHFSLVDPAFLPLLRGLLQLNPRKRLTASQCLSLPLFAEFPPPEEGPLEPVRLLLDDNCRFKVSDYRREIYACIPTPALKDTLHKHPSLSKSLHPPQTRSPQPLKQKSVSQPRIVRAKEKQHIDKESASHHKKRPMKEVRPASASKAGSKARSSSPYDKSAKQIAALLKNKWGSWKAGRGQEGLKKTGKAAVRAKLMRK